MMGGILIHVECGDDDRSHTTIIRWMQQGMKEKERRYKKNSYHFNLQCKNGIEVETPQIRDLGSLYFAFKRLKTLWGSFKALLILIRASTSKFPYLTPSLSIQTTHRSLLKASVHPNWGYKFESPCDLAKAKQHPCFCSHQWLLPYSLETHFFLLDLRA